MAKIKAWRAVCRGVAGVLGTLLGAAVAAAQRPQQQTPIPPLGESVTVSITNVDVVVTDSHGHRVSGLTRDDFEVAEDGVPQKITNFYAVSGGRVTLDDGSMISLEEPKKAADVPANLKAKYVIYIDNLNIDPLHRNKVITAVEDFAKTRVGPNAEAMVVTFNRSLKVRLNFTSEPGDVLAILEQIKLESGGGTTISSERQDAIRTINDAQDPNDALQQITMTVRSMKNDLQFTTDAIKTTLDSLGGVDGRKELIYVSDGLPQIVGDELFDTLQKKFPDQTSLLQKFEFDMSAAYASIIREANANGVTISAIDATGLAADSMISAENRQLDARPSSFMMQQNLQAPLRSMAEQTGGVVAVNTNDPSGALKEIAEDFSNFYSLGYRSTQAATDRPHTIEVKVKRKGLRVRYRKGYLEKTIETRTAEAVVASLHYPRNDNPLSVAVVTGNPKPYEENYLVPLEVVFPMGKLTMVPDGNIYRARVFIYFVVMDAEGKQSDLQIREQEIKVPAAKFDSVTHRDYKYPVQLLMGPGAQHLAVAVRDGVSNVVSFARKDMFISVLQKRSENSSKSP